MYSVAAPLGRAFPSELASRSIVPVGIAALHISRTEPDVRRGERGGPSMQRSLSGTHRSWVFAAVILRVPKSSRMASSDWANLSRNFTCVSLDLANAMFKRHVLKIMCRIDLPLAQAKRPSPHIALPGMLPAVIVASHEMLLADGVATRLARPRTLVLCGIRRALGGAAHTATGKRSRKTIQ